MMELERKSEIEDCEARWSRSKERGETAQGIGEESTKARHEMTTLYDYNFNTSLDDAC